jgi:hypothetical protein
MLDRYCEFYREVADGGLRVSGHSHSEQNG